MRKVFLLLACACLTAIASAQAIDQIINAKEVERIERTLSSDDMQGRATFSPGIDKAAAFIAAEFTKTGLATWDNGNSYLQRLPAMISAKPLQLKATVDDLPVNPGRLIVLSGQKKVSVNENSGLEKVTIPKEANIQAEMRKYMATGKNYLILVDTSFSAIFSRFAARAANTKSDRVIVMLLTATAPSHFSVEAEFGELGLQNVVGIIPGKSRKDEYVIFSGHYDHLGIRQQRDKEGNVQADSIFNGANDDAAGTTAMLMLAQYFKALNNNERTLVFAAFTAEEVGGFGAQYFSKQFKPEAVKAMFNIEMIGTESKWGRNSAYITGYEKTDMGKMLQANLEGTGFTFYPDPYPSQQLFYRSDNATLARLGVPAHTISTSKMDNEPNYHKASDEIGTLDMENMAMIIKAIALSSRGIVSGKDTPSRVDTAALR